jgi:type I restriction enzyme S subunit
MFAGSHCLPCYTSQQNLVNKSSGTTVAHVNLSDFRPYLVAVPPINEQQCIVSKIDELIPLIEKHGNFHERIQTLNKEISSLLKKSILQEAIQGKLVPQLAEEGTAQDLVEQIELEKQKLVKEGKLKKSALTGSAIYKGDDNKYYERINKEVIEIELPYDYPDSWCIVRLKDVCQLIDGVKMTGKGVCLDAKYLRGKSSPAYLDKGRFVHENDSIILVDGENSGEVFTVPEDGYMGSTFKQLWLSTAMYKPYLLAFILFYKEALRNSKRGAAIPHLNKELFYNLPIGIPPYKEQKRIAQRIDVLFQLLK